jgi:hypothetical protein
VAQQLGETYHAAVSEMRSIGLSHSAGEKLARFLLDWCDNYGDGKTEIRAKLTLTHEEIAQMIGASRETVTPLFADFKKRGLLEVKDRQSLYAIRAAWKNCSLDNLSSGLRCNLSYPLARDTPNNRQQFSIRSA